MSDITGAVDTGLGDAGAGEVPLGPCQPWANVDDLPEGCPCRTETSGGDTPSDEMMAELIAEATDVLWIMLGRPAIGICEVTVHPETWDASCWPTRPDRFTRFEVVAEADYLASAVLLRAPVADVIEVLVDGVALDPSEYELHDGQWLVRTDGTWPIGGGPADEARFVITYTFGVAVPPLIRDATVEIANYLWSQHCANTGGRISPAVDSLTSQGASYRFRRGDSSNANAVEKATQGSQLPAVQLARASYNPTGQPMQPYIYSPDLAYRRRRIRAFS